MTTRWDKVYLNKTFALNDLSSPRAPLGLQPLVAGGASAFITTTLYQPLDFLKTQIQEPTDGLRKIL